MPAPTTLLTPSLTCFRSPQVEVSPLSLSRSSCPTGVSKIFQLLDASLGSLCTAYDMPPTTPQSIANFQEVAYLVAGEPALLGSMNDLAQSLANHHLSLINCGRVLDSLRKAIAPNVIAAKGWPLLHSAVNVNSDYLK